MRRLRMGRRPLSQRRRPLSQWMAPPRLHDPARADDVAPQRRLRSPAKRSRLLARLRTRRQARQPLRAVAEACEPARLRQTLPPRQLSQWRLQQMRHLLRAHAPAAQPRHRLRRPRLPTRPPLKRLRLRRRPLQHASAAHGRHAPLRLRKNRSPMARQIAPARPRTLRSHSRRVIALPPRARHRSSPLQVAATSHPASVPLSRTPPTSAPSRSRHTRSRDTRAISRRATTAKTANHARERRRAAACPTIVPLAVA